MRAGSRRRLPGNGHASSRRGGEGVRHRLQDGSVVWLRASRALAMPATNACVYEVSRWRYELTSGGPDLGEFFAAHVVGVDLDEAYRLAGGTLRVGARESNLPPSEGGMRTRARVGVWRGGHATLCAHMPGPSTSADMVALFASLGLHQTPGGLRVVPAAPHVRRLTRPTLYKRVPGVGVIECRALTRDRARELPPWPGTRARGGELFVADRGTPAMHLLLVSATALTRVLPQQGADEDELLDLATDLVGEWAAA